MSPAPVFCLGTARCAFTSKVGNECPGKHTDRVLLVERVKLHRREPRDQSSNRGGRSSMILRLKRSYPTQLRPPPAARPNVPQMQSIMLKAGHRIIASEAISPEPPTINPTKRAHVTNRDSVSETPNSMEKMCQSELITLHTKISETSVAR